MKIIFCETCGKETEHDDMGIDMAKYRWKCKVCGENNKPKED
jgi:transposase-like protein